MDLFPGPISEKSIEVHNARISGKSRIIYLIITISFIAGLIALPFVYVDISVLSRGFFQTDIDNQLINSPLQGRIAYINSDEGMDVSIGDTLVVIVSEELKVKKAGMESLQADIKLSIADLEMLLKNLHKTSEITASHFSTSYYMAEFMNFKRGREIKMQNYKSAKSDHNRNRLLYNQGIISEVDYEHSFSRYTINKETTLKAEAGQRTIWENELNRKKSELIKLTAELKVISENIRSHTIISPVAGYVIFSSGLQPGSLVLPGQVIAGISPKSKLVAVFYISPSDIGFIKEGQKVRFQVDAFNYHRWGMLEGEIVRISEDIVSDNSMQGFRIVADLSSLVLTRSDGICTEVIKGMSFTARIVIIRRSIMELLFDKADSWLNPYNSN